ncbi:DinB family protein [Paenibacillus sp.]|uniref:DinB family protein n=1 Tax=Paenibacillus sp. TaxID=58172 RepID=UPI002D69CA4C|nr:DinB family protein [Paenibacillus sp.]HZG58603.1 DinB family protein [Paenibacillus sp.]
MPTTLYPGASIARQMDMIYHGNHWHASLKDLLGAVSADEAIRRPPQGGHTIYEIVQHLAYSAEEVTERLRGREGRWDESRSWVETPTTLAEDAWRQTIEALEQARNAFRDQALALGDEALLDAQPGAPSKYELVQQLIHHEAFHAGQIAYLRRMHGKVAIL